MKHLRAINPNDEVVIVRVVVDDRSSVVGVIAQFQTECKQPGVVRRSFGSKDVSCKR